MGHRKGEEMVQPSAKLTEHAGGIVMLKLLTLEAKPEELAALVLALQKRPVADTDEVSRQAGEYLRHARFQPLP